MPKPYKDLREWIELVDQLGELKRVKGADWNLEMGAITELIGREGKYPPPAILFDGWDLFDQDHIEQNEGIRYMAMGYITPLK